MMTRDDKIIMGRLASLGGMMMGAIRTNREPVGQGLALIKLVQRTEQMLKNWDDRQADRALQILDQWDKETS